MYSIHLEKSTAHAVSAVRKTRLLYFDRRRGVWLQNRSWDAAQAGRHALDRQGRQRHHCPALQQAQRTLPGFLGTPLRAKAGGCMTSLNLMCAQGIAGTCRKAAKIRLYPRFPEYSFPPPLL